jgi:hypothetical protein
MRMHVLARCPDVVSMPLSGGVTHDPPQALPWTLPLRIEAAATGPRVGSWVPRLAGHPLRWCPPEAHARGGWCAVRCGLVRTSGLPRCSPSILRGPCQKRSPRGRGGHGKARCSRGTGPPCVREVAAVQPGSLPRARAAPSMEREIPRPRHKLTHGERTLGRQKDPGGGQAPSMAHPTSPRPVTRRVRCIVAPTLRNLNHPAFGQAGWCAGAFLAAARTRQRATRWSTMRRTPTAHSACPTSSVRALLDQPGGLNLARRAVTAAQRRMRP